jgi:3-hydroxyisobutyrate dehydrogenase
VSETSEQAGAGIVGVVGVVGLGNMGGPVASHLAESGVDVVVMDLRPELVARCVEHGARAVATLKELVDAADVVSLLVRTDDQVRTVGGEALESMTPGKVLCVQSTALPATVVELAQAGDLRGVHVVDAPVSGGGERGARGVLSIMVGGPSDIVDRIRPVLDVMAADVFHVGPVGAAQAAKLVNNLITLGSYAVQMEAMALGAAYGLSEDVITTVLSASQADSRTIHQWGRMDRIRRERVAGGAERPEEMYEMFAKDVRMAALAGGRRDVVMPMSQTAVVALPWSAARRDRILAENGWQEIPCCDRCGQELAAPFRALGLHPECSNS